MMGLGTVAICLSVYRSSPSELFPEVLHPFVLSMQRIKNSVNVVGIVTTQQVS